MQRRKTSSSLQLKRRLSPAKLFIQLIWGTKIHDNLGQQSKSRGDSDVRSLVDDAVDG